MLTGMNWGPPDPQGSVCELA